MNSTKMGPSQITKLKCERAENYLFVAALRSCLSPFWQSYSEAGGMYQLDVAQNQCTWQSKACGCVTDRDLIRGSVNSQ